MAHQNLEKMASTAPMLPNDDENVVKMTSKPTPNGVGKILLREDTILSPNGCAGCGRGPLTCISSKEQWSVLCWGQQTEKKYYCLLLLLSATFVLSLLGTVFFCFTNTINDVILSNMVVRNNSLAFSIWRRPNVQPVMKVHIFNYTNWEQVRDGIEPKLAVKEMGPYVYSQQLERVNIKFEGDKLSYQERNNFKFLPDRTVGMHFDQLNVPNLPLLGAVSKARYMDYLAQFTANTALLVTDHPNAFVKLPVQRFLWGYHDRIIDVYMSLLGQFTHKEFGLLSQKNGTSSDRFTINTGEIDKDKMNVIERFNGKYSLDYYSDECNSIDSTDGSIFPTSLIETKSPLFIFMPNLCRRIPFVYQKEIELSNGVVLYRYTMPSNVFDHFSNNSANQCYCEYDTSSCPPQGVINVTACTMGAPAMASFPHFHLGDPKLRDAIDGMVPNKSLHESYLDIHPKLGIALLGKSSLQINMQVRKSSAFSAVSYLEEGLILPVAWVEMAVEELPESLMALVYHGTFSTAAVQLGLTALCMLGLIVSSICLCVLISQRRRMRKPCLKVVKLKKQDLNIMMITKPKQES